MSDDVIVFELKKLKTQHKQLVEWYNNNLEKRRQAGVLYSMDIQSCYDEESIKNLIERQMLTNAFALKNGADLEDIRQLCIAKREFEIYKGLISDKKQAYILNEDKNEKMEFLIEVLHQFLHYVHGEEILDKVDALSNIPTISQIAEKRGLSIMKSDENNVEENLSGDIAMFAYLYMMDHWPWKIYTKEDSNSIVNQMLNKCIFPPYGVAISIGFEDEGQRVLPWSGNLTDSQISHLRRKMHELAGNEPLDICRVILAAYCRFYFNDEPTVKQVSQEFYPVHIDPGFFSREVTSKIKGTKPKNNKTTKKSSIKSYNTGLKIWVDCRNEQMVREAIRCDKCRLFYDTLDFEN